MKTSIGPSVSAAMLEGMEGLIALMKDRKPAHAEIADSGPAIEGARGLEDDDRLDAAPWDMMTSRSADPAARSGPLAPGDVVGRYVVLQELGAGAMGIVYAAYDPELDRRVALKLLLHHTRDRNARIRLQREAQALAKISHPNVVAIHDVGTVGEQVWVAMEFVRGWTLRRWLEAPRGWQHVLGIMREAGKGLAAAHSAGLLHRDFKPDNVMVGDDGRVRVMDFGLARVRPGDVRLETEEAQAPPPNPTLLVDITRTGTILGTPSYMAPEQYGAGEITVAADQFAFCVALWEALYGERPFGGRTPRQLAANVLAGRLRSPPRRAVPSWLRRVCERGLLAEPRQRWPSMDALLDALARGRTRARIRTGLVAAFVGLALGGAGVLSARRSDESAEAKAAVEHHVTATRAAAARALYLFPPRDEPTARTAYVELLELEALADELGPSATEAGEDLRREITATLVRLGDSFWDSPGGRAFAVDYYVQALVFDPRHEAARKRAPLAPGMLTALQHKAATLDFEPAELSANESLLARTDTNDT